MLVSLNYHCMEDDKPLQVTPYLLHPTQFFIQGPDKMSPYLPARRVVAAG